MLRVLADLSVPEIARVLQKPESAVKALLRRGFASLRRTLAAGEQTAGRAMTGRHSDRRERTNLSARWCRTAPSERLPPQ